jgi:hypothetical protein
MSGDNAIVIKVNERYFVGFGKKGRLQTSWSLPPAKLFAYSDEDSKIRAVMTKLEKKGYKNVTLEIIGQVGEVAKWAIETENKSRFIDNNGINIDEIPF